MIAAMPIRNVSTSVLIVEDDPTFRSAFVRAVRAAPDLALAGEADDLPDGRRLLEETRPDVLLVDIGLPSGSGIELIHLAKRILPNCDSMVVTVFGDEQHVLACIEAGATGYLLKGTNAGNIVQQIRSLRQGGSPISPTIARQLLTRLAPQRSDSVPPAISPQEQKVLDLTSKGYTFEEIAQLIGVSRHTIETYVKRIYRKLQVHNKTEAIYEARKLGIVRD